MRYSILLWVLIVAVVGGVGWVVWRSSEPMYRGKALSVWLDEYVNPNGGPMFWRASGGTDEALRHIGTNAIPTLLRRLKAKDSPLKLRLVALAQKQHVFKVKFKPATMLQAEGIQGFEALRADGRAAVPELLRMYEQDSSPDSRCAVSFVLCSIGPAAVEAVPLLLGSLGDTNWQTRSCASAALGQIHAQPTLVVPALVKCLRNPNGFMRMNTANALGNYGADAKAAVPELLRLLDDSDKLVSGAAKAAVARIDPEAAAKAAVERNFFIMQ